MEVSSEQANNIETMTIKNMSAGHYDVRLARNEDEVRAAQKLRYEILFKNNGGRISEAMLDTQREEDEWDGIAYHVIVVDTKDDDLVVGTVRLVSDMALKQGQSFYTEQAFNIARLRSNYSHIIELSRACVSPSQRGGVVLMLMWKFTIQFVKQNHYEMMFGCVSFLGTDYREHAEVLSYLYEKHAVPPELMPSPRANADSVAISEFCTTIECYDGHECRSKIPTLLRGYLKVGARISEHAIVDPVFNTTFVAVYVDVNEMLKANHLLVNK